MKRGGDSVLVLNSSNRVQINQHKADALPLAPQDQST